MTSSFTVNDGLLVNGSTRNASAVMQVDSTSAGFLPPRMTTAQRNAIVGPAEGLTVFNTDTDRLEVYTGSAWVIDGGTTLVATNNLISVDSGSSSFTSGNNNIALGVNAGDAITSGYGLICIGRNAGSAFTTGLGHVAIGAGAMEYGSGGDASSVAVGFRALRGPGGEFNVAVGAYAMEGGADESVAVGNSALNGATSSFGVAVGDLAGSTVTTGDGNTFIGNRAGSFGANGITTGGNNVCLGFRATSDTNSRNGAIAIGYSITTAAFDNSFSCRHRAAAVAGNAAEFVGNELVEDTSSERYKREIQDHHFDLSLFSRIRPRSFKANPGHGYDNDPEAVHLGLIAEELNELYPGFVTRDEGGLPQGISYAHMVVLLIQKIQELEALVRAS